jgi:hypothetical protein
MRIFLSLFLKHLFIEEIIIKNTDSDIIKIEYLYLSKINSKNNFFAIFNNIIINEIKLINKKLFKILFIILIFFRKIIPKN